jgi:hypothetical protein
LGFFSGRNCNSSQQREYDVRLTKGHKRKKEKRRTYPTIFFEIFEIFSTFWAFELQSICMGFELLMQRNGQKRHNKKSKQTASVLELAVAAQLMSLATSLRTLNPAATTKRWFFG